VAVGCSCRIADAALERRLPDKDAEQVRRAAAYAAGRADPLGAIRRAAARRSAENRVILTRRSAARRD